MYICTPKTQVLCVGLVVQLVRMPPCHGGGRGVESRPDRKASEKSEAFWFLQSSFNINYTFKKIFYTALIALSILLLIVWLSSITFSAIHLDSKWGWVDFGFTTSGGNIGFFIILLLTTIAYTVNEKSIKQKIFIFLK